MLVNAENPLSKEFTVQLCEVEGEPVDVRIEKALKQMMSASKKDGAELVICSAYRSVSTQERLYDNSVQTYRSQGYDETQSMQKAGFYTQPPGASEHHTGLAIDFVTDSSWELSEQFAETKQYRWLAEHAAEYGFVERYPKEKEAITQIGWEPWHYRFVGIDTAQAMKESGLCLEEYLETIAKNNGN